MHTQTFPLVFALLCAACGSGTGDAGPVAVLGDTADVRTDRVSDAPEADAMEPDIDVSADSAPDPEPDSGDVERDPDVERDADARPDADAAPDVDANDDADTIDADVDADVESDPDAEPDGGPPVGIHTRPTNETCLAGPSETDLVELDLIGVFSGRSFEDPVVVAQEPDPATRWYVAEREGRIRWFDADASGSAIATFLNISRRVDAGAAGFVSFAFHPDYPRPWELYASYVTFEAGEEILRVSRFGVGFAGGEEDSEEILLSIPLPSADQTGGQLAFGRDGYLYIALGDGGGEGDEFENAQNRETLLGSLLRIDVDRTTDELPYAIPADNPFVGGEGADEIYAWGFRRPSGLSIDAETGAIWLTDVGEGRWDEINRVELGGNYGWPIYEGESCYLGDPLCDEFVAEPPALASEPLGGREIVGGFVYRGDGIPDLVGTYLYAENGSPTLWGMFRDPVTGEPLARPVIELDETIVGVFAGVAGEAHVTGLGGQIYRLDRVSSTAPVRFPDLLSETGCFRADDPSLPVDALIPFEPSAPFWSDGVDKRRWFAIPDGTQIGLTTRGDFEFPPGTVLAKDFRLDGELIETRLFVQHDDGVWAGFSYEWNEEGTDATLVPAGAIREFGDQTWLYPSNAECLECHTFGAGFSLGPETVQLNWEMEYPSGVVANQMDTLVHLELFSETPPEVDPLPNPYGDAPVIDRARAWLHTNCSGCHRPLGPEPLPLDFRSHVPDIGACNTPSRADFGIEDARIILPGEPDSSVLISRISRRGLGQMPPLGSYLTDDPGLELMREFVLSGYCESLEE